jgi:hypothetical protein
LDLVEDAKKIKLAMENPEDFRLMKQIKRIESAAAATQRRTSVGPVTGRNPKLENWGGGSLRWRGPRGFGRRIYFGDFRDVGCVSSFFGMFEKRMSQFKAFIFFKHLYNSLSAAGHFDW